MSKERVGPEFWRPLRVDALGEDEQCVVLEATEEECANLAERFSVLRLTGLKAEARVKREGILGAQARVQFQADVVQRCVVTLEPVHCQVGEIFELSFFPTGDKARQPQEKEWVFDCGSKDPPGDIVDGVMDLGEVIAEYLALSIDPYPRKEGIGLEEWVFEAGDANKNENAPFAALKHWRGKA